ncbi:ankyrin repeat domain-containing protein [Spirillospora sp. NPDC029432]|uniref:ankyrin repeat domain-containing protein n=1 Tax=Spirillospora sp. NPDC029432 TaxID=3154599 RepID=UPI0034533157
MGTGSVRVGASGGGAFTRLVAGEWETVRRFAVPAWTVERATGRRLAGDWRGACAAAGVGVAFEPDGVRDEYGADVAEALADDLRHLAPDLLRWHIANEDAAAFALSGYRVDRPGNPRVSSSGTGGPAVPMLHLERARRGAVERMCLRFGRAGWRKWMLPRHLWDVRWAGELLVRGGGRERAPFFEADGTPRERPGAGPEADPVARAERISLLHERGEVAAAFAAAGIELRLAESDEVGAERQLELLRLMPIAPHRIEAELRRLVAEGTEGEERRFVLAHTLSRYGRPYGPLGIARLVVEVPGQGTGLRAEFVPAGRDPKDVRGLPDVFWQRPPDLDLVRAGRLGIGELHPLVSAALFPGWDGERAAAGVAAPGVARVRCRGEWHEVSIRNGHLRVHSHSEEERRRESALKALGGQAAGCFAVRETWDGRGFLPRALREQRRELFRRVSYGDTEGVLKMLDAGHDPHTRDGNGHSLLHCLGSVRHEELLPRLLAAGVDLEARDAMGRTPLLVAAWSAPAATVRALLAAGARPAALSRVLGWVRSIAEQRGDLDFLVKLVEGADG